MICGQIFILSGKFCRAGEGEPGPTAAQPLARVERDDSDMVVLSAAADPDMVVIGFCAIHPANTPNIAHITLKGIDNYCNFLYKQSSS
jgi:hypothetical protein